MTNGRKNGRGAGLKFAVIGSLLLALFALPVAVPAAATGKDAASANPQDVKKKAEEARKKLEEYQRRLKRTRARERGVEHNVSVLDEENSRLNSLLISTARRIQDGEAVLTRIEMRLRELGAQEELIRGSLAQRRGKIAGLLASMQRIGREPPPVIVTQRQDALKMVRSAMLLGALYPQLKNQADELAAKLTELVQVTNNIRFERDRLYKQGEMLQGNRISIKKLLAEKKARLAARKSQLASLKAMVEASEKNVSDLSGLIAKLDKEIEKKSRLGAYEKKLATGKTGGGTKTAFVNPGRIEPAVAFAKTKGILPMPVSGRTVRDYGSPDRFGAASKGIVIETRPSAQVTAPSDGWVVYSGAFRSYGNLLIINAGGGYHVLLAGLDRIDASLGQFVLAGEPVGQMGAGEGTAVKDKKVVADAVSGTPGPTLYIEFRKDGRPIDPDPWWETGKGKV